MPTPAIGLDVGAESLKLLQLAAGGGANGGAGYRVQAALCVPIPEDVKGDPDRRVAFAGETIKRALGGVHGFVGRRVVAALPKELLHYKTHRLQALDPDEIAVAAKIDARDLFRFDPDSAYVQHIDAGEIRQGLDRRREVILVAAGKRYVEDVVAALDDAGAEVESLEIDPCALWRAASRLEPAPDADGRHHPRVLLDVGAAQSRLVIGCGGVIRVVRPIGVGADHIRTAIARTLGMSTAEAEQLRRRAAGAGGEKAEKLDGVRRVLNDATHHVTGLLAREVLASVRYHAQTFRGPAPRRVELVGGDAGDPQIRSVLAATLFLPVKPVDLFRGIDTTAVPADRRTATLGEWAVAMGLAMKRFPGQLDRPALPAGGTVERSPAALQAAATLQTSPATSAVVTAVWRTPVAATVATAASAVGVSRE